MTEDDHARDWKCGSLCEDHRDKAVLECRKQTHERDRPHYMERVGIYAQGQELRIQ